MNLLAHRIVDIVLHEGARFSQAESEGGRERVESVLSEVLEAKGMDPETVSVEDFRMLFHDGWQQLLDRVCPSDTHFRVNNRFHQLIFT